MCKEAYDAFNNLALKFDRAVGTEGKATEAEVAQMVADYINALADRLSDEDLTVALDEFRLGKLRMKNAATSVKLWQESDVGQTRAQEFKRFIAELYMKMNPATAS